jgi:hypothetical protein
VAAALAPASGADVSAGSSRNMSLAVGEDRWLGDDFCLLLTVEHERANDEQ